MGYDTPVKSHDPTSISLLGINIRNPNNTIPSTGSILTVSSGAAYMLPITTALDSISSLSNLSGQIFALNSNLSSLSSYVATLSTGGGGGDSSNWAAYPAICTINAAGYALSSIDSIYGDGNIIIGPSSFAIGSNAVAIGYSTIAVCSFSFALGNKTYAFNDATFAVGEETKALSTCAFAQGYFTTASGICSHAEGSGTLASGFASHSEGTDNIASGNQSHVEGANTIASGSNAHAEGHLTTASGINSHAEGTDNIASGDSSHAGGEKCTASGFASFAHGYCNATNNFTATSLGCYAAANTVNALTLASSAHNYAPRGNIPGTSQSLFLTLSGQGIVSNTETQLLYMNNSNTATPWIRININSDGLTYTDYFCHTVTVDLTGSENTPVLSGGTSGNGLFFGTYRFYVYWDTSASPVAYIADRSGSKATSGGNVTLTASDATNMLSNGNAAVTVRAYMTSNANFAEYSITAQSTGWPLNWLAQVRVGELLSAK
jgi:hypothetical protein